MSRNYRNVSLALVALSFVASAVAFPWLPERIPIHWNIHGEIDGWGGRWTIFLMPFVVLFMMGLMTVLPRAMPKGADHDLHADVYGRLMLIIVALFCFIHAMVIYGSFEMAGGDWSSRLLIAGLCLFLGLIGNLLGKVDRNFFIGVRTPWTLSSDRVWIETHRLAAWVAVASSAVGFVIALVPPIPPWIAFVVVIAGFIYPAVHSYVLHRRFAREGTL